MLVTFTTNAYADITIGDVAPAMLNMMGHSKTVPGAILAADVPIALDRLISAINAEKSSPPLSNDDDDKELMMSITDRALPLIELLTAAAKVECNVMWK